MKRILAAAGLAALSCSAQQVEPSPEAAHAEQKIKEAFAEPSALPKGIRTRGLPPSSAAVRPLTRSGSVIRQRGPVPTLVPAQNTTTNFPAAEPPAIDKKQVSQVTTELAEARVNPTQAIAFDNILFELNSATISPPSIEVLRGIANGLKALPDKRFLVEGHTCDLGPADFNLNLSCLRAEAVCGWLIRFGVPPAQLQPMGFGPAEPLHTPDPTLSQTANEPIRAQNRRAAFRLLME